jgi:hypothetical protein
MDWRILVFYAEPEAKDKIYYYPPIQNTDYWTDDTLGELIVHSSGIDPSKTLTTGQMIHSGNL